jgi:3-hydroxyisobutyrate dehydrogenase-like beta-hydroxyacid dehydrogenase
MGTVGFVGLGNMGGNMAARFLAEGRAAYGTARNRGHSQWLQDQGLRWVDTPRVVAAAADVVFGSVRDDGVLTSVARGLEGIIAGLDAGKVWVDFSTVSPEKSRELAELVSARGVLARRAGVGQRPASQGRHAHDHGWR